MGKSLYDIADALFKKRYVHYEAPLAGLCCAWAEFEEGSGFGSNLILHGRGGYGKSEMAKTFAEALKLKAFVQSVGASTTEDSLWGEIDLAELRQGDSIKFHLARSFMEWEYVILEEGLDLPGRILDDLKDTLSARVFRRGLLQHPMKTRTLVICTNRNPEELRSQGGSPEALMQRFPLEVEVKWPNHDISSYRKMYELQRPAYIDVAPLFAIIAGRLADIASPLSPREALDLQRAVVAFARSRGRDSMIESDFKILSLASKFARQGKELTEIVEDALDRCGDNVKLNGYRHQASRLIRKLKSMANDDVSGILNVPPELERIREAINRLQINPEDGGFEAKQSLLRTITAALKEDAGGAR